MASIGESEPQDIDMEDENSIQLTHQMEKPGFSVDSAHLDSFQDFIDDFNTAMNGVLARNGSPYDQVHVLFLRWEDDVFVEPGINNGIQGEIDQLERVFVDDYGFKTETYLIPSQNSQRSLQKRIFKLQDDHESRSELLIVYYGGHGVLNDLNQSIWEQGDGPSVDWYSIQHLLEYAAPDVAIFLDCCYAASADKRSVDGTVEVLAACDRQTETIGISPWSFTSRLTEVLKASADKPLTITMLHAELVNYRGADGLKKLLKTPIHSIMSNKDKASIRLYPNAPTSTPRLALSGPDLSQQSSSSGFFGLPACDPPTTRVLISVSLKNRIQDAGEWLNWLTGQQPAGITDLRLLRPEGLWGAHSTLGLISMPVAVWNLFPNKPAYRSVGQVVTANLLSKDKSDFQIEARCKEMIESTTLRGHSIFEYHPMPVHDDIPFFKGRNYEYVPLPSHNHLPSIRSKDSIVAVIGLSTAGKKRFVDAVTASSPEDSGKWVRITELYTMCTLKLPLEGKLHLIDTPSLHPHDSSVKHIRRISNDLDELLSQCWFDSPMLHGIIYLHPLNWKPDPELSPFLNLTEMGKRDAVVVTLATSLAERDTRKGHPKKLSREESVSRSMDISKNYTSREMTESQINSDFGESSVLEAIKFHIQVQDRARLNAIAYRMKKLKVYGARLNPTDYPLRELKADPKEAGLNREYYHELATYSDRLHSLLNTKDYYKSERMFTLSSCGDVVKFDLKEQEQRRKAKNGSTIDSPDLYEVLARVATELRTMRSYYDIPSKVIKATDTCASM